MIDYLNLPSTAAVRRAIAEWKEAPVEASSIECAMEAEFGRILAWCLVRDAENAERCDAEDRSVARRRIELQNQLRDRIAIGPLSAANLIARELGWKPSPEAAGALAAMVEQSPSELDRWRTLYCLPEWLALAEGNVKKL